MGKKDHLSRDQKRKAKLKKRAERSRTHQDLAYSGSKYKTDAFAPIFYRTEVGIYESYVMSERELTDDDIRSAIEQLVIQMRRGPSRRRTNPTSCASPTATRTSSSSATSAGTGMSWKSRGAFRDDLIGILRTILNSISIWSSQSMHSRGYLHYIEGFLKKTGVSVQLTDEDFVPLPSRTTSAPGAGPRLGRGG